MTKLKIFSIYDSKAVAHITPFYLANEALAIRAVTQAVNDEKHQFHNQPEDYTLFLLGEFDIPESQNWKKRLCQ